MNRLTLLIPLLVACGRTTTVEVGEFTLVFDEATGRFDASHAFLPFTLEDAAVIAGSTSVETEMSFGSFRFTETGRVERLPTGFDRVRQRNEPLFIEVAGDEGPLGVLAIGAVDDALILDWAPEPQGGDIGLMGLQAACGSDPHFLGLGGHAFDVDHVGEAFSLWVSEPGIGKDDTEEPPGDWFLTGTRHSTSFPVPWLLQPELGQGLLVESTGRVDVDLCASDPDRFQVAAVQDGSVRLVFLASDDALGAVQALSGWVGRPEVPQEWVFAPWNDAIRGPERVREVAAALRGAGAPSSVIWSEDWKGAKDTANGYHLTGEWFVDETKYPDASALAAELEADGFKWFAYFSPFVAEGTQTWDAAEAAGVLIRDDAGNPYTFNGATFEPTSMVDLSSEAGRGFAKQYMKDALAIGFDGWMADYAEWLPVDAQLAGGDPWLHHNAWPLLWQRTNAEAVAEAGADASFFVRSGWTGTSALAPVVWGGDQRTSFDVDDGMPTVVPMGVGLAASGVPVFTHDVAGYQSVGNPPSDKELWFRWASLGAFSPILRTHHGAFEAENWQFDTDAETLAHWAKVAREHTRLFPYRYGLAARASADGTPMLMPVAFRYDDDWGRMDAWLLGDALLVAPVLEAGVDGREVDLPDDVVWYDWATRERATSGYKQAGVGEIPVFAASGTTVPTLRDIPDTLARGLEGVVDLDDVDGARVVYLFGGGGSFTEADGTSYEPTGAPTGPGEVTTTVTSGTIEVAGVSLAVSGPIAREYTVVVVP